MTLAPQDYRIIEAPNGPRRCELLAARARPRDARSRPARHARATSCSACDPRAASALPIVVLSSRGDEAGKVEALDLGADDYVTKPFGMGELMARIRAALRHRLEVQGERAVFQVDDLSVDLVRRIVRLNGAEVKLSPGVRFPAGPGAACRQGADPRPADERGLDLLGPAISAGLRAPAPPEDRGRSRAAAHLLTETGVGYRLRAPDDAPRS